MALKNGPAREKLLATAGWHLIGWDAAANEERRKNVTVECLRDKQSFKYLPYHGSLALWRSLLNHRDCKHGRKAPAPPKKCATCGQNLPENGGAEHG